MADFVVKCSKCNAILKAMFMEYPVDFNPDSQFYGSKKVILGEGLLKVDPHECSKEQKEGG